MIKQVARRIAVVLRKLIAERFAIERIFGTPPAWLPPHLASQAWFVARKR